MKTYDGERGNNTFSDGSYGLESLADVVDPRLVVSSFLLELPIKFLNFFGSMDLLFEEFLAIG